ncbi:putative Transmembrane protein 209 [Hypsibius exemplaris]|uniref:Transmembrane protein 209 n=1 Tax=Hypsibius exemplaris TaxID=2072580 RepID=A0A1W0W993_HYPEX|nr:putative Transmembrane protein 209 [Hypsibius exemplaris]
MDHGDVDLPPPESTFAWLHRIWRSSSVSCLPVVWLFQRIFSLKPLNWLAYNNGPQLTVEIELRKQTARHLRRLHQRLLYVALLLIGMEILRQPILWFFDAFLTDSLPSPLFNRNIYALLFYLIYGVVLLAVALFAIEIIKFSLVPALQVTLSVLESHHAADLCNTALFAVAQKPVEDPRDEFARRLRSRQTFRHEADQSIAERTAASVVDPTCIGDSSLFLRTTPHLQSYAAGSSFQRQPSNVFGGRTSPSRSWNDSLNRSLNRSMGGGSGHSSKSSSPSVVLAAQDWDPLDRQEVDSICGQDALMKLLAQEDQFEKQRMSLNDDDRMNWSPHVQALREQTYQTSSMFRIPSPKKLAEQATEAQTELPPTTTISEEKIYPVEDYSWLQLKVSAEVLHLWTENVRLWLADTVMSPLLMRIDQVNVKLKERLRMDNVVGETAPDQLRQIAQQCRQDIPELLQVIPFLDISMQQDYVVRRLRELSKDGVLGDYCWNSGAPYGGQPWQDFLPTDAAIVMHCFITFLDVLLPPDPHAPNWRSFSHRHVLRSLSMWKQEDPQKPMIHQATSNPPKYEVLLNGQFLQVAEGKNNVFHTILLFTRLLYLREKAGRGYANLGAGRVVFKLFESYYIQ